MVQWYYGILHIWSNNRVLHATWSTRKDTHETIRQMLNFPSKENPLHAPHHLCLSKSHQMYPQELHLICLLCFSWSPVCSKTVFISEQVSIHGNEVSRHDVRWTRWAAALKHTAIWHKALHCQCRMSLSVWLCATQCMQIFLFPKYSSRIWQTPCSLITVWSSINPRIM